MRKNAGLLTKLITKRLKSNKKLYTYGTLAEDMGTNARAVGQAVRAMARKEPALAKRVVYGATTKVKAYAKRK